jgi:hypothetical protein
VKLVLSTCVLTVREQKVLKGFISFSYRISGFIDLIA